MIILATPTRDTVTAGFAADLARLSRRHPDLKFLAALGIYIANLRNYCVNFAQQVDASHLLFVDSDMRFPEDALDRLLAAHACIAAANYVQRTAPEWWTARVEDQSVSSVGKMGLQQVESVGCGLMLIQMSVFDRLTRPWFSTPFTGQDHLGEDVYFCQKARDAGFVVWIDHDVSQRVRHQGSIELGVGSQEVAAVV